MNTTIVRHRFSRSTGTRAAMRMAVRYLESRPLSVIERPMDRSLFDRLADGITRADATSNLMAGATVRIAYHRLILSPGCDSITRDRESLMRWTRRVLADLEWWQGRQLIWVAAVHRHTQHAHVHVLVGATARSLQGDRIIVRFSPADYATLRNSGDHWAQQANDDQALLQNVEQYLSAIANTFAFSIIRSGSGGPVSYDEDEGELRPRRADRDRHR